MGVLDKLLNAMKLNDDYEDEDYLDDEIEEEYEEERPAKKSFFKKNESFEDDFQDDFKIKEQRKPKVAAAKPQQPVQERMKTVKPQPQQPTASSKVAPMRPKKTGSMEVCVIKPKSMEDAKEITETLLASCTVVLNMEGLDLDIAQRIIDFACGSCYAINGTLQKISGYIFIITPSTVDVSGDIQEILSGAFDVPTIRSRF